MKAAKPSRHNPDRIIKALEGLIADYRAGRGDVLNRVVNDERPGEPFATSLREALTLALFGTRAMPTEPLAGNVLICNQREYEALAAIGAGSAERGAVIVIKSALSWLRRDRAALVAWVAKNLPTTEDIIGAPVSVTERGFFGGEYWQIPVRSASWFRKLQKVAEASSPKKDVIADAVIRILALHPGRHHLATAA